MVKYTYELKLQLEEGKIFLLTSESYSFCLNLALRLSRHFVPHNDNASKSRVIQRMSAREDVGILRLLRLNLR